MSKETVLDPPQVAAFGHLELRFQLCNGSGGVAYHRASIMVGGDVAGAIAAVNARLAAMGWPEMTQAARDSIQACAGAAWTPAVVDAWKKHQEEQPPLPAPPDEAKLTNHPRHVQAAVLAAAGLAGKSAEDAAAAFTKAWASLG